MGMGTPTNISLDKVMTIFDSLKGIEENTKLDFKIAYRLGRLSDSCRSYIRAFEKVQSKKRYEINNKVADLKKGMSKKSKEEQDDIILQIRKMEEEFRYETESAMDEECEVQIPEINLKDFEGKEMSQKFFNGMAQWITE